MGSDVVKPLLHPHGFNFTRSPNPIVGTPNT
jgi:hypothetical protein